MSDVEKKSFGHKIRKYTLIFFLLALFFWVCVYATTVVNSEGKVITMKAVVVIPALVFSALFLFLGNIMLKLCPKCGKNVLAEVGKSDVDRYSTAETRESLSGNNVVKKHVHIRVEEGNILLKCDDCGYETTERYKIKREV